MQLTRTIGRGAVTALILATTVIAGAGSAAGGVEPKRQLQRPRRFPAHAGEPGAISAIALGASTTLVKSLGLPPGVGVGLEPARRFHAASVEACFPS